MNVSILICTYGDPQWQELAERRALPSASNQRAHEVIVRHETDGTLAQSRNEAAMKATGDYLCYLDADDELGDGYVDAMVAAARGYVGNALWVPAVQYLDVVREEKIGDILHPETGLVTKSRRPQLLSDGRPLYVQNYAVIGTLIPRTLFLELGGFAGHLAALEDWELFLRCERGGAELIEVEDAVYRVYRRKGSRNADQTLYWEIRKRYEPKRGRA